MQICVNVNELEADEEFCERAEAIGRRAAEHCGTNRPREVRAKLRRERERRAMVMTSPRGPTRGARDALAQKTAEEVHSQQVLHGQTRAAMHDDLHGE